MCVCVHAHIACLFVSVCRCTFLQLSVCVRVCLMYMAPRLNFCVTLIYGILLTMDNDVDQQKKTTTVECALGAPGLTYTTASKLLCDLRYGISGQTVDTYAD